MAEAVYRRLSIDGGAKSVLKERKNLLIQKQTVSGKTIQVRNPASVTLTGVNRSCDKKKGTAPLPLDLKTWGNTYQNTKSYPSLKSVTIEYGGDWGLAQTLSAVIECYTISDLDAVIRSYLYPGNDISISIHRSAGENIWNGSSQSSVSLKGFKTATFSFDATEDGTWVCKFTAVSAAAAMKNVDMGLMVGSGTKPMQYISQASKIYGTKIQGKVRSISELILFDSQRNGLYTLEELQDGHVLSNTAGDFDGYSPEGTLMNKSAALVVYKGTYLQSLGFIDGLTSAVTNFITTSNEMEQTNMQVYVTLGYIVNRIIHDQIKKTVKLGMCSEDANEFLNTNIQFDPILSKTKVPKNLRSGDPLNVLILGGSRGDYRPTDGYAYKDFEDIKAGSRSEVSAHTGNDIIDLNKILIHKDAVLSALKAATNQREANADNADVKDTKEEVIPINDFFKAISDIVNQATGGAISLRLAEDVKKPNKRDLIVVDQNCGWADNEALECWVFDPIGGDGSTRNCSLNSNVGSDEYKAGMYSGMSKKGDAVSTLRECDEQVKEKRKVLFNKAWQDFQDVVFKTGVLAKNQFGSTEIDACKSAMSTMFKNRPDTMSEETIHFPGISMNINIDGTWGFIPGNGMTTTQMPLRWRKKSYFLITKVTHTISESDWETNMTGILAYYDPITYL